MRKVLLALLLLPTFAFGQYYGPVYNPTAVAITGGSIASTPISGSTGSFTTLSASSTVSGAGFTNYFASPPAIGGTTPAAGAFTTLSATGAVSGSGFSTYLASPPAIGGTSPSTGKFTSVTNTGLTANSFTYPSTGGLMASTGAATNGQLLVGSTGSAPVAATLTGTSNQISVTNGAGSITLGLPSSLTIPGTVTSYNGAATVAGGIPVIGCRYDATAQQANIPTSTVLCSVPSNAMYRVHFFLVVTQAATTSSTMPNVQCLWTDADTGVSESMFIGSTSTANTVGTYTQTGGLTLNAKASTNITCGTSGYGSSGATPMQFAIHIRAFNLGN